MENRYWLLVFFFFLFVDTHISAIPSQVILIRHAEKVPSGTYLSLKGRQRAAALLPTFLESPSLLHFGPPAAIYIRKSGEKKPAIRWAQTVMSLADELNMPFHNQYGREDVKQLVQEILQTEDYEGKMILVCWSHGGLPNLAALLGAKKAPKKWDRDVFDRFWILTFEDDGKVTFEDLPQKLLYGDSSK